MMKVYCTHKFGNFIEFVSEKTMRRGRICDWCKSIWHEGDAEPVIMIGRVERT